MKTRAVVSAEHGKPLVIEDLDLPDPGPTHVIVKQFATGICHSQIPSSRTSNTSSGCPMSMSPWTSPPSSDARS